MKKSHKWFVALKIAGVIFAVAASVGGLIVSLGDNAFVTHAMAKEQHDSILKQLEDRAKIVEEREDLHYKEVTRQLEKIDGRVERIHSLLLERK